MYYKGFHRISNIHTTLRLALTNWAIINYYTKCHIDTSKANGIMKRLIFIFSAKKIVVLEGIVN